LKGPGNGGSVDERLDHILAIVLEKKRIYEELQKEIVHLKETVSSLEKENIVVKRELRAVKEATNRTELSSRFLTVSRVSTEVLFLLPAEYGIF
jgi:hypothetical protein